MNRADQEQAARDLLRTDGCTCSPRFIDAPAHMRPAGVVGGGFIQHEIGCTLGDQIAIKNRAGIMPTLLLHPSDDTLGGDAA